MCTMNQGSRSVNTGNRQLFDVVGFDSLGEPRMKVGESLSLKEAIGRSLGFNTQPSRLIAAVVPSGSTPSDKLGKPAPEAPRTAPNASSAVDDSGAKEGAEDAGDDEPEVRSRADVRKEIDEAVIGWNYAKLPALSLQFALLKHLDSIEGAILEGLVDSAAHVGIIARSLQRFCSQVIERQPPTRSRWDDSLEWKSEEFDDGLIGETNDDELESYLNHWLNIAAKDEWPELFAEAEEEAPA